MHTDAFEWRCFHCGEVFTCFGKARDHFGLTQNAPTACQIDIKTFRHMQYQAERYREEDTDLHRQIARMTTEHAAALRRAEEEGYAKGLRDAEREHA